jgi:hypothetical protein
MAAGISKIWALRMPGGMTKIIKSDSPLSETDAKDLYKDSFKYRSARCLLDKEAIWPLCRPIDEAEMHRDFTLFLQESPVTGKHKYLVEV